MFDMLTSPYTHPLKKLIWMRLKAGARAVWDTITGNPVSFTAKAAPLRKLEVAFSPVQSLNGYDSPWPAGGGKNLVDFPDIDEPKTSNTAKGFTNLTGNAYVLSFDIIGASKTSSSNVDVIRIHYTDNTDAYGDLTNIKRVSDDVALGSVSWPVTGRFYFKATKPIDYISFYWRSDTYIKVSAGAIRNIMVEAGNAPTAFAPYSNLCPISGWDSLNVEQRGVNVWDEEWELGNYDKSTGVKIYSADIIRCKNKISVVPSKKYYIHSPINGLVFYYGEDDNYISWADFSAGAEITIPQGAHYLRFRLSSDYGTTYNNDISINYPATDTAYHAYNPLSRSISISIGETVYSGTVDVVTGVGEITWAKYVITGSESWTAWDTHAYFAAVIINKMARNAQLELTAISSVLPPATVSDLFTGDADTGIGARLGNIYISASDYANRSALTGGEVVYELRNPIPIQLTTQEVSSLLGDNTMWTDADSLTVEYRSN